MCKNPISIQSAKSRRSDMITIPVPCGKCFECKKATRNAWLFRLTQELKVTSNHRFVTLTYAELPTVDYVDESTGEIFTAQEPTLVKRDLQNYFKRLRKAYKSNKNIRYYAVGEYGSIRKRPHYHIILLNCDDNKIISSAWSLHGKSLGIVDNKPLLDGGIPYVLKYLSKPKSTERELNGRLREFSVCSLGIGKNYLYDP